MQTFVTSDLHFNHKSMITEKWRPFDSVSEMNKYIISRWNQVVRHEDLVYVIGDVAIGKYLKYKKEIRTKLRGKIVYVHGNHDSNALTQVQNLIIRYNGKIVELVHNPEDATGTVELVIHGHHHHKNEEFERKEGIKYFNVNLDFNKFRPYRISDVIGRMKKL